MFTPAEETIPDSTPKRGQTGQSKASLLTSDNYHLFFNMSMPAVFATISMRCLLIILTLLLTCTSQMFLEIFILLSSYHSQAATTTPHLSVQTSQI